MKAVDFAAEPQDRRARRRPDRGDAARPRRGRGRPRRRPALDASASSSAPAEPDPARALGAGHGVRRHRRGRQHRLRDHRRPGAAPPAGTFHLLDLVPEPDPADPDLERFASDRDGLKRELAERIKRARRAADAEARRARAGAASSARGRRSTRSRRSARPAARRTGTRSTSPTPAQVAAALGRRARAAAASTCCCTAPGSRSATSCPTSRRASSTSSSTSRSTAGSTCCTRSRDAEIGTAVVFSSIAGRFGNAGQTDYSAANDLLCKSISRLRRDARRTRGVAIDWTAWAEIGMASRGSIPKMMEMAGIDMLPPAVGVRPCAAS